MSQWRQDPLTGRWVVVAADRGRRPNEFRLAARPAADAGNCPFCPGREDRTTPETAAYGRESGAPADGPGWRVRAFPNMYPALSAAPTALPPCPDGFVARPGIGSHEVIVYAPDHAAGPTTVGRAGLVELLTMIRDRSRALAAEPGRRYVLAFVNHGPEAGATLAHPHAQIIAAPVVPDAVQAKLERLTGHREATGRCLLCDLAERERRDGARLVVADEHGTVITAWAGRLPYEMMLIPARHAADLPTCGNDELLGVAGLLETALGGLERLHPDPPLNLVIHGAPLAGDGGGADPDGTFHWHLEILPRLTRLAGFEAGTGFFINAVPPERAARRLRGSEE